MSDTTTAPETDTQARSNGGAPATIEVENPATGEVIAAVQVVAPDAVAELVERARRAQPGWEALGFAGRTVVLKRCQKWIVDNSERVIDTIVSETGKTYEDALSAEVAYATAAFAFWAKNAEGYLEDEKVKTASPFAKGRRLIVRHAPVGVAGVIGPWNYPLTNSFGDCIPALAAGNSVLLKPSEVTPLTSMLMGEMLRECGLPEDVYQVVPGYGETAQALIDEVDFVMFTGSTATGKKVMERAARTLTPVSLELGGKDPMIVCADADVERAANAAVHYSMQNAGQTCISTERVYVEEPIYDDFVRRVTEKVNGLRQGTPGGPGSVDLGAVTHPPQSDVVERHVRGRRRARRPRAHRRQPARPGRALLRAHGARGRGPLDGLHAGGDLRPDRSDHEGAGCRRGRQAGQRLALRAGRLRLDEGRAEGGAPCAPARGRGGDGQRRADQLRGARAADGRLEGVRPRHPSWRGRDPQVHEDPDPARHELRAAEARHPHDAVQHGPYEAARAAREAGVRARQALRSRGLRSRTGLRARAARPEPVDQPEKGIALGTAVLA